MTLIKINNITFSPHTSLSVQVTLTGLSFLVTDSHSKETLFFSERKFEELHTPEELLLEMEQFFSETPAFETTFENVSVIYANPEYTLVPETLFDETKLSDYLKFNAKLLANDFITSDPLDILDIRVVYVPYMNINNYLVERCGSFQYYHATSVLLQAVLSAEKRSNTISAALHVQDTTLDLIIQKDGALLLCNTYQYKTPEDFIYFILFSFEQLRINPDAIPVTLLGAITKEDPRYEMLYTYIRTVSFSETGGKYGKSFEGEAAHQHFLLKNALP